LCSSHPPWQSRFRSLLAAPLPGAAPHAKPFASRKKKLWATKRKSHSAIEFRTGKKTSLKQSKKKRIWILNGKKTGQKRSKNAMKRN
jgi:hypothetical protein